MENKMTTEIPQLNASIREKAGKRYNRRLRKAGQMPAVIYGHKQEPAHISINNLDLTNVLHQHTRLVNVVTESDQETCLIKEVQWDHLGKSIIHADLTRVNLSEKVSVDVDIAIVGEAVGLKISGAFLEHPLQSLTVQCSASDIPESIAIDVSTLQADEQITVGQITLPTGVTCDADPQIVAVAIHVSTAAEEETDTDDAAAAQPEVIGRSSDDEAES